MFTKSSLSRIAGLILMSVFFLFTTHVWSAVPVPNNYPTPSSPTPGMQVVQKFDSLGSTWIYLLYLPASYESQPNKKWPVILYFSVVGATYDQAGFDAMTKGYGISKYLQDPSSCKYVSDSFIVITPWLHSGLNPCWTLAVNQTYFWEFLLPLITHVTKTSSLRIDQNRIHTMGYCFGAGISMKYFAKYPTIPASMSLWAPGDPGGACINDTDETAACVFKDMPMQWFHNKPDQYSPWQTTQTAVNLIRACGNTKIILNLSETGPHESWCAYWGAPCTDTVKALYDWMLAQKKTGGSTLIVDKASAYALSQIKSLQMHNLSTRLYPEDCLQIIASDGSCVYQCHGTGQSIKSMIPPLARGIYFAKITAGKQSIIDKVIIK